MQVQYVYTYISCDCIYLYLQLIYKAEVELKANITVSISWQVISEKNMYNVCSMFLYIAIFEVCLHVMLSYG